MTTDIEREAAHQRRHVKVNSLAKWLEERHHGINIQLGEYNGYADELHITLPAEGIVKKLSVKMNPWAESYSLELRLNSPNTVYTFVDLANSCNLTQLSSLLTSLLDVNGVPEQAAPHLIACADV